MKTIEQAAKDFIWESGETHPQSCFEAGAKWAQMWISVDKELPKLHEKVFVKITIKGNKDFEDAYDYSVATFMGAKAKESKWDVFFGKNKITHWKYIE